MVLHSFLVVCALIGSMGCGLVARYESAPADTGTHLDAADRDQGIDTLSRSDGPLDLQIATDAAIAMDASSSDVSDVPRTASLEQIHSALASATAPCLDDWGDPAGPDILLFGDPAVTLVNGAITLEHAPPDTVDWVGNRPSVVLIWDLNACGTEDPFNNDGEWKEAGLLIRGARLTGDQAMRAEVELTWDDINLIDVHDTGRFESGYDFGGADDAELVNYPNLRETVNETKRIVMDLLQDAGDSH